MLTDPVRLPVWESTWRSRRRVIPWAGIAVISASRNRWVPPVSGTIPDSTLLETFQPRSRRSASRPLRRRRRATRRDQPGSLHIERRGRAFQARALYFTREI